MIINCTDSSIGNKKTLAQTKPIDWQIAFREADSFEKEITIIEKLIKVDSLNNFQQLIANRLQTFDWRHLQDPEKIAVLHLYELSFIHNQQPSANVVYAARAKLTSALPSGNNIFDKRVKKLLNTLSIIIKALE